MDSMVKKYQQKFRKVKEEMENWEQLQSHLISLFSNASHIIQRLQVIGDKKYYGCLRGVDGIEGAVTQKQLESLGNILASMKKTMEEIRGVVLFLEKMVRDSRQVVKGGSQLSTRQLQQRIGVKPSLTDCIDGLTILHEMHSSEYLLKASIIGALQEMALKARGSDLGALRQLLVDQPNIPKDEDLLEIVDTNTLTNQKPLLLEALVTCTWLLHTGIKSACLPYVGSFPVPDSLKLLLRSKACFTAVSNLEEFFTFFTFVWIHLIMFVTRKEAGGEHGYDHNTHPEHSYNSGGHQYNGKHCFFA